MSSLCTLIGLVVTYLSIVEMLTRALKIEEIPLIQQIQATLYSLEVFNNVIYTESQWHNASWRQKVLLFPNNKLSTEEPKQV